MQEEPCISLLFGSCSPDTESTAALTWDKANMYYYKNMARLRKLTEVRCNIRVGYNTCDCRCSHVFAHCAQSSRSPHSDLSALEVAAASRNSEHLFYIVQRSRSFLSALASMHDQLGRICSALAPTGVKHGFASSLVLGQVHTCCGGRQEGASADPARCCSSPWLSRTLDCRPQPILSHTCRIGSCQGAL